MPLFCPDFSSALRSGIDILPLSVLKGNSDLNSVFVQMLFLCHGILCVGFISLSFILSCCCLSLLVFGVLLEVLSKFHSGARVVLLEAVMESD